MAKSSILGLFLKPPQVAEAVKALRRGGFADEDFEILTGFPYPEGAFGEKSKKHRLFVFPFIGALSGFAVAVLLTVGTQLSYPVVTGGKPILSLPPMVIIMYEGTLLGAIVFTVLGVLFESRLPKIPFGLYDRRITEGYIGVLVTGLPEKLGLAEEALRQTGAEEVRRG